MVLTTTAMLTVLPILFLSAFTKTAAAGGQYYDPPGYYDGKDTRKDYEGADRRGYDPEGNYVAKFKCPEVIQRKFRCIDKEWYGVQCGEGWGSQFRNADASCTNPDCPRLGAAFQPFCRLLHPHYYDGTDGPRTLGKNGKKLPSARTVSEAVHSGNTYNEKEWTVLFMGFGQFISHDLLSLPKSRDKKGNMPKCCKLFNQNKGDGDGACFIIRVKRQDSKFQATKGCLSLVRSLPVSQFYKDCHNEGPREQLSSQTAALDGSAIYGSSQKMMNELRTLRDGLMKMQDNLLPSDEGGVCEKESPGDYCFKAGDARVNFVPTLAGVHVIFVRFHNHVARRLKRLNPRWKDERLFQETRRIVVAVFQHIAYNEFLPIVLGYDAMHKYGLDYKGPDKMYTHGTKLCLINSFMSAAYRFGHSTVPRGLIIKDRRIDLEFLINDVRPLQDGPYGVEHVLEGSLKQLADAFDRYISDSVREHLFEKQEGVGTDLAAINIQRGRDHGVPPYNHFRRLCGLPPIYSFYQYSDNNDYRLTRMSRVYKHVDDIDLFTGGVSEAPVKGGTVGPTFACIIGLQFHLLKFGDSYWFENQSRKYSLTPKQVAAIKEMTMSRLICDTTQIHDLQTWAFQYAEPKSNPIRPCGDLRPLRLSLWKSGYSKGKYY